MYHYLGILTAGAVPGKLLFFPPPQNETVSTGIFSTAVVKPKLIACLADVHAGLDGKL